MDGKWHDSHRASIGKCFWRALNAFAPCGLVVRHSSDYTALLHAAQPRTEKGESVMAFHCLDANQLWSLSRVQSRYADGTLFVGYMVCFSSISTDKKSECG